jgi:putative lipoprotein
MRRIVLSLMSVATLALAGCNNSSDAQQKAAAAANAGPANSVTGTVALRDNKLDVSADAKLDISLMDVSTQSKTPLATKTIQPANQFPISFQLPVNPADVNPSDIYTVQAVLTDGDRRFTMPLQAPVLTKGAPSQVAIQLAAEMTPGEKELAAFNTLQKNIGGLKMTQGTALATDVSRSWQIFRKGNDVAMIRELVDYGDKGFTDTYYSFRDGKVWVIVQEKKASKTAKPTSTERAGWNAADELVLKQNEANGKITVLADDAAADLRHQAEAMFAQAKGGKGK